MSIEEAKIIWEESPKKFAGRRLGTKIVQEDDGTVTLVHYPDPRGGRNWPTTWRLGPLRRAASLLRTWAYDVETYQREFDPGDWK